MYDRDLKELVEYGHQNFDVKNIKAMADDHGMEPIHVAQELLDVLSFRWNRMTRENPTEFNKVQDRIDNLRKLIKKRR